MKAGNSVEEGFGKSVSIYTRRQAIEDGVSVDLMQREMAKAVREAGFKYPVAMTIGAFAATICQIGRPLPEGQDVDGRLSDLLWMLRSAVLARQGRSDRAEFQVRVWNGERHEVVNLWSLCGPGDDGEPVITIMLQGED